MLNGNVYYCWSCDGHCKVQTRGDEVANCPRCGETLTNDSRVAAPHAVVAMSHVLPIAVQASWKGRFAAAS